jgi:heme exporter protein A
MASTVKNLVARNLACERNGRLLFSNLDFTLKSCDYMELRGPNGAGKSSLLRLLAGLLPQSAGTIEMDGKAIADEPLATHLHFIAHDSAMKAAMTVRENLQFWCDVLDGTNISAALSAFSLEALRDDPVQLLSAGQRRRLALSRLFVAQRPLWLLDEPATALDQNSMATLHGHMKKHVGDGGMILAAVHGETGLTPNHTIDLGAFT